MENKTTWKENRPLACLVLVLAVLVGVLGIGTAKVRGVAGTALDYYNQNMAADFTARETAAQTILGIAGQELGEDDAKVQTAAAALAESQAKNTPRAQSWRRRWALCTMRCLRPRGTRRKAPPSLRGASLSAAPTSSRIPWRNITPMPRPYRIQ